jgi:membrane-associated phospholipid phosphatase
LRAIETMGGPHGAFPSLHVGASFLVVWFDLRHRNFLRGLIYVPLVLMIALATIVLRYHWVVDLIAGVTLALVANHMAPVLLRRWRRPQLEAGS